MGVPHDTTAACTVQLVLLGRDWQGKERGKAEDGGGTDKCRLADRWEEIRKWKRGERL